MKSLLFLAIAIILTALAACNGDSVTLAYDETVGEPILESDMQLSPRENVEAYLADAGVTAYNIDIFSSPAKNCACGKNCLCKLNNAGSYGSSCADAETICKKTKYIEVQVGPDDVEALTAIGFASVE